MVARKPSKTLAEEKRRAKAVREATRLIGRLLSVFEALQETVVFCLQEEFGEGAVFVLDPEFAPGLEPEIVSPSAPVLDLGFEHCWLQGWSATEKAQLERSSEPRIWTGKWRRSIPQLTVLALGLGWFARMMQGWFGGHVSRETAGGFREK